MVPELPLMRRRQIANSDSVAVAVFFGFGFKLALVLQTSRNLLHHSSPDRDYVLATSTASVFHTTTNSTLATPMTAETITTTGDRKNDTTLAEM